MPVTFSIRALVVEGHLGGVRPGMDRDTVRARLGPPSELFRGAVDDTEIWRYGNFEIFFDRDLAYTLFHDWLVELEADDEREIDAWILGRSEVPSHDAVVQRLTAEQVPFIRGRDRQNRRMLDIPTGARLLFEIDEDTGVETWTVIQVVHPDYASGFTPDEPAD